MKNATVVWDRASYLVVCPNIGNDHTLATTIHGNTTIIAPLLATTSEVLVEYADLSPKMALKTILVLGYVFHYWPTEY